MNLMSHKTQVVLDEDFLEQINEVGGFKNQSANIRKVLEIGLQSKKHTSDPLLDAAIENALLRVTKETFKLYGKLMYQILYFSFMIIGLLLNILVASGEPVALVFKRYKMLKSLAHKSSQGKGADEESIENIFSVRGELNE